MRTRAALAILILCVACDGGEPLVARAGGRDFTVAQVVTLLEAESFPNQPDVVLTIADLWIDYTLLARVLAEDSTLSDLDVSHVVEQQVQQELILALREKLVRPDTVVSDEEIDRRSNEITPGSRVHARHILLAAPQGATAAQRDSTRAFAENLLARIRRGERFEDLAREYSSDRVTAEDGGDLGWFGRGELVAELEQAAFALKSGEVSNVVESEIGLHIIRVDEHELPTRDQVRAEVRAYIQQMRFEDAANTLVAGVEQGANVTVADGAADLVRQAAENPGLRLSKRARGRALVTYTGGSVTVGETLEFMQSRANQFRVDVLVGRVPEQSILVGLAQRELLVARAKAEGIEITSARRDSLTTELRDRLYEVARQLDLTRIPSRQGESEADARDRKVQELLGKMIQGARDVMPLGSFSFLLRERYSGQVYPTGVQQAVARISVLRGPELSGPPLSPSGGAATPTPP